MIFIQLALSYGCLQGTSLILMKIIVFNYVMFSLINTQF